MSERKTSEAQLKAVAKYKEKNKANIKKLTLEFSPTEMEMWKHIESQHSKKSTYIKDLIRTDMKKEEA